MHVRKVDSASIANLDKDCFIIPIAYLDRFLPDGVNVRVWLLGFRFFSKRLQKRHLGNGRVRVGYRTP